jgi:hypothetical protein
MQQVRAQTHALQRRGIVCAGSCCRGFITGVACTGTCCWPLQQYNRRVKGLCRFEARRHASSSHAAAPDGSAESPQSGPKGASLPKEGAGTATTSEPAAPGAPLDLEADAAKRKAARDALIQEIISRDKVIFELKRQHELSMLRVQQNQERILKNQEDRGMYYEQNSNVHTFDTISVGLYSQRSTLYHTMSTERLRNLKIFLMVFSTFATCVYLYYRYMINPEWEYVERPMKMIGSRVQAVREQRWKLLSDEERYSIMRKREMELSSQNEAGR